MNLPTNDITGRVPKIKEYPEKYKRSFKAYYEGKKISECGHDEIFQLIKNLVNKIGLTKKNSPTEGQFQEVVKFIANHMGGYNIQEVELAFDYQLSGALIVEIKHFQTFTCEYIGEVMKAYNRYFRGKIREAEIKAFKDAEKNKTELPMPEKTMAQKWEYVKDFFESRRVIPSMEPRYYTDLFKWCQMENHIVIDQETKQRIWDEQKEEVEEFSRDKYKRTDPLKQRSSQALRENKQAFHEQYAKKLFYYHFKNQ